MTRRRVLATCCLLALSLTGCGGSSGGTAAPSSTPTVAATATPASAEDFAGIAAAYEGFFNPKGTVEAHTALLENGEKFTAELTKSAKDPAAADLSAKLLTANVLGDSADVTYDLIGKGGTKLLPGAQGVAVRQGGTWKVSQATYCTLISLQDPSPHPGCG